MRLRVFGIGLVVLGAAGCTADASDDAVNVAPQAPSVAPAGGSSSGGTKRHVVVFKSETLPGDATARIRNAGGKVRQLVGTIGVATIDADATAVSKLAADGAVAAIGLERSWTIPQDRVGKTVTRRPSTSPAPTPSGFIWGAQWDQRRIHAPQAWNNVSAASQAAVTVAVLDTGVMFDHPDLDGQVTYRLTTNYSSQLGCDSPELPAGYPIYPTRINTVNGNLCEDAGFDPNVVIQPHGSHVAGTIAAKGQIGVAGVGPDLKIAAYKVFDRVVVPAPPPPPPPPGAPPPPPATVEILNAFDGPIFAAIADAANRGIPVINMSLGGVIDRADPAQNASWQAWNRVAKLAARQGTLIVAAAGNEALNTNGSIASIPADLPSVFNVSASAASYLSGPFYLPQGPEDPNPPVLGPVDAPAGTDVPAFYSNFGAAVDIAAPGGDLGPFFNPQTGANAQQQYMIVSTVPAFDPAFGLVPAWSWLVGTSMASPHVAGVAGLVKARHPSWGPQQIRARIISTATSVGRPRNFGAGIVDAERATR